MCLPPSPYLVHRSCPDADRFDFCTNEDIWAKAEALRHQAGVATRGEFEELEKAMGISFNPHGLLWDEELREHVKPVGCHTYDPMHALLSNGICQNETGLLLVSCRDAGVPYSAFRDFAKANWEFLPSTWESFDSARLLLRSKGKGVEGWLRVPSWSCRNADRIWCHITLLVDNRVSKRFAG